MSRFTSLLFAETRGWTIPPSVRPQLDPDRTHCRHVYDLGNLNHGLCGHTGSPCMGCGYCRACTTTKTTTIIPEFPGYMVCQYPDGVIRTEWEPVKNVYSPPVLHRNMYCKIHSVYPETIPWIAMIIGKDGRHLKSLSARHAIDYIFFRHGRIEIWGNDPYRIDHAEDDLLAHISRVVRRRSLLKSRDPGVETKTNDETDRVGQEGEGVVERNQ